MVLNEDTNETTFRIGAYQPGAITINNQLYQSSLIIGLQQLIPDWAPQTLQELRPEDWQSVLELKPEVLLLGTGQFFKMPDQKLLIPIYEKKLSVESMDTSAACRTYMALAAEGRQVVAALLIR